MRPLWLLAALVCVLGTHLRFGAIDWEVQDLTTDEKKRYATFHYYEAIRGSLESAFCKGCALDAEQQICNVNDMSTCWRLQQWNGYLYFGDASNRVADRSTWHSFGSTPSFTSATSTRVYSDGSSISSGLQNWWMTERVAHYQYPDVQSYIASYSTCCRQYSGVRNVVNGESFILKATVNLQNVRDNSVDQNPHCSAFPIYFWPYSSNSTITAQLSLANLCSTPFDNSPTFTWSSYADSGLITNGDPDSTWAAGLTKPILEPNGLYRWGPTADGLYAFAFTVSDKWGNTNSLDIIFDVSESSGQTPYFVEVRTSLGGAAPTSTIDIFSPPAQPVIIGSTVTLSIWAYAPAGTMREIIYSWTRAQQSTISSVCSGVYCELQFTYSPILGQRSANLCLIAVSTVGSYIGAPSDPSNTVTFCIPITVTETDYIYLSGYIRDFNITDKTTTGIPYEVTSSTSVNFMKGALSGTLRPVYDDTAGADPAVVDSSKFALWFEDSSYSITLTLSIVLSLISGTAGTPGSVYECNFDPWYPIECAGYDTACLDTINNDWFTYDVITYFQYSAGVSIKFKTSDYLWVFVDGKLVLANTNIESGPTEYTVNLDVLTYLNPPTGSPTSISLTSGKIYSLSLFYVHRSLNSPVLNWQVPGGSICDAVSGANTTFVITDFSADNSTIVDTQGGTGMVGIEGRKLRIASTSTLSSSAVWYAKNGVAQKFFINDGFQTKFTFEVGDSGASVGSSIPGFAFVIQADSSAARGGASGGLGYEGITNAAAIEFDGIQDNTKSDPTYSHAGFHVSSADGQAVKATETTDPTPYFTDTSILLNYGEARNVTIQYIPGQQTSGSATQIGWFYIFLDNNPNAVLTVSIDASVFDIFNNNAYVGFTAGTGSANAAPIYIYDWSFRVVQPSATLSSFASTSTKGEAGSTITGNAVQARDSCNNDISTGGNAGRFTATLGGADGSSLPVSIIDLGTGVYQMSFTPTIAQTYTLSVNYDGQPINNGANTVPNIQISYGSVSTVSSVINNFATTTTTGTVSKGSFQLRDQYSNVITADLVNGDDATVSFTIVPDPTTQTTPGSISISFNSSYWYNVEWTTFEASTYNLRITFGGSDITGGFGSPQSATVNPGSLSVSKCSLGSSPNPVTTLASGTESVFQIKVADAYGNEILTNPTPYTVNYTVLQAPNNEPACTTLCSLCNWEDSSNSFKCKYTRFVSSSQVIVPKIYNAAGLVGIIPLANFTVDISVGDDSPQSTVISTPVSSVVGSQRFFIVQARDLYNVSRTVINTVGVFSANFTPAVSSANIQGPSYIGGGQYIFRYFLTNATKYRTVSIEVYWIGPDFRSRIFNGTLTDTWIPSSPFTLNVPATVSGTIGVSNLVNISLFDAFDNPTIDDQTSTVSVRVTLPSGGINTASVFYTGSENMYSVNWTTTAAGSHTKQYFVSDVLRESRPVSISPGMSASGIVTQSDEGWGQDLKPYTITSFRVTALDRFGNEVGSSDGGSTPFELRILPVAGGCTRAVQNISATSNQNGVYNFTYNVTCQERTTYKLQMWFTTSNTLLDQITRTTLKGDAIPGKSILLNYPEVFSSVVSDVPTPFSIIAKFDNGNNRTIIDFNQGFSFTITAISLPYFSGTYNPDIPVTSGVNGSAVLTVSGLKLAYAGNYSMRIFDGLELQESIDQPNGNGYIINVIPGGVSRLIFGSTTTYATTLKKAESTFVGIDVTAGSSEVVSVFLNDKYGQPITNSSIPVIGTITYSDSSTAVLTGVYNSSNKWNILLTGTSLSKSGTHSLVVSADNIVVGDTSYTVSIAPSTPSVALSKFVVTLPAKRVLTAGTAFTLRVYLVDVYGNNAAIPSTVSDFVVNITNTNTSTTTKTTLSTLTTPTSECIENGIRYCFETTLTPTIVGVYSIQIFYQNGLIPSSENVTVQNSPSISSTRTAISGLVDVGAGTSISFNVQTYDIYGNPFLFNTPVLQAAFSVVLTTPTGTTRSVTATTGGATYSSNGLWTVQLSGCAVGVTSCESACLTCHAGTTTVNIRYGSISLISAFSSVNYTVTALEPYNRQIVFNKSVASAIKKVGEKSFGEITIQTYDWHRNFVTKPNPTTPVVGVFYGESTPICDGTTVGDESVAAETRIETAMTYTSNGVYQVYMRSTVVGTYTLTIFIGGSIVCANYEQVEFVPTDFRANETTVTGYSDIAIGGSGSFYLNFMDPFGNMVKPSALGANTTIYGLGEFNISSSNVTWIKDGSGKHISPVGLSLTGRVKVDYSTTTAGTFPFVIAVDGNNLTSYTSASGSNVPQIKSAFGEVASFSITGVTDTIELNFNFVQIQALDKFGNLVTDNNYTATLVFEYSGGIDYTVTATQTNVSQGVSTHRYQFFIPGIYIPFVSIQNRFKVIVVNKKQLNTIKVSPASCSARNASTPYKCDDGSCVSTYFKCADSPSFCTNAYPVKCWDGSCKANSTDCPCPSGTERCPTGACQATGTCLTQESCTGSEVLCPTYYVCRQTLADCPSPMVCPPNAIACPDGVSCARSYARCPNITRGICATGLKKCIDGSCVASIEDCPTPVTCPIQGQVRCYGGACRNSSSECPQLYECDEISLTSTVRCQDGSSCRAESSECPSSTTCPSTFVRCVDGSCAASVSACSDKTAVSTSDVGSSVDTSTGSGLNYTNYAYDSCPSFKVLCSDGSCAANIAFCPVHSTCPPSKPVRCSDGTCQEVISGCGEPQFCPKDELLCPDGTCITSSQTCPTSITCTSDFPIRCPDRSCAARETDCQSLPACDLGETQCPDGTCRGSLSQCSSQSTCPDKYPIKCPDGSCRASIDICISPSRLLCRNNDVKCPDGSCAPSFLLCPTIITCPSTYSRCLDGTCRLTCDELSSDNDPNICQTNQLQCPQSGIGISCREELYDCPTGIVCPISAPVRCMDGRCKESIDQCALPPTTYSTTEIACPDGSFASSSACGTGITCRGEARYSCWDNTCRRDPKDCPTTPDCAPGLHLCSDGSCNTSPDLCRPLFSCTNSAPVRCADSSQKCQISSSSCNEVLVDTPTFSPTASPTSMCTIGTVNCRDGFCAPESSCQSLSCPTTSSLNFLCDQGTCASGISTCPVENGCQYDNPYKCPDGSCAKTQTDCPMVTETCDLGFSGSASAQVCTGGSCTRGQDPSVTNARPCADGSCLAVLIVNSTIDYSNCPGFEVDNYPQGNPSGCSSSETRCNDGSCASSGGCTASSGDVNYCPTNAPYVCQGGLCRRSQQYCPEVPSKDKCPTGKVRCFSGDCVDSLEQCPLIAPCQSDKPVRCLDGTCKAAAKACPIANTCPSDVPYRCKDGVCAKDSTTCIIESTGCPGDFQFKCSASGQCVSDLANCVNTTVRSTGCDSGVKCWNGECVSSVYNCPSLSGCPSSSPNRCGDGSCVADAALCTSTSCNLNGCGDGGCESSISNCRTSYGCNMTHPFRCVTGECRAKSAHNRLLNDAFDACYARVVCSEGLALCADGSCQAAASLCPSVTICGAAKPILCPDFTCAASTSECFDESVICTPSNPILCKSGSCVSTTSDCVDFLQPQGSNSKTTGNYQCFDGTFVTAPSDCLERSTNALSSLGVNKQSVSLMVVGSNPSMACNSDEYMCSNGLCVNSNSSKFLCEIVPACPTGMYRCGSGACMSSANACGDFTCPDGLSICADGSCRAPTTCPGYNGCGPDEIECTVSQLCVKELGECTDDSTNWLTRYTYGAKASQIGICSSSCYRDLQPEALSASVFTDVDTTIIAVDDATLGQALTLTVPAGSVESTDSSQPFIFIAPVAESYLRTIKNFHRRSWFPILGNFLEYPQTVLSPVFRCWRSTNIQSFQLNITVSALIDRTYPHIEGDICLASSTTVNGEWRCIHHLYSERVANPVTLSGSSVTASFRTCDTLGGEGSVYAFIYNAPGDFTQTKDENQLSYWERNWIIVAMILIACLTLFACLIYYLWRQLRYREKYKIADRKLRDKKMELERMEQVGANAGNVGTEDVTMENSPLQMQVDNMNKMMESVIDPARLEELCKAQDEALNKRTAYISDLQEDNKKLEGQLMLLRNQIQDAEQRGLLDEEPT